MTWKELRYLLDQRILDSDEVWHINIFYGDVLLATVDDLEIRTLDWSSAYEEGKLRQIVGGTRHNVEAAMPYNCLKCGCAVLERKLMTEEELAEIKTRARRQAGSWLFSHEDIYELVVCDIPKLLAEVERLQGELWEIENRWRNE